MPPPFLFLSLQPSRWTCRGPWLKHRRPARRSAWSLAILTAAGCPQRWPSSSLPTMPLCRISAFSRAGPVEPSPMGATPSVDPCLKMNWTKVVTGPSSTTPSRDTAATRKTLSRSSPWQTLHHLHSSHRPLGAPAPSFMSISYKCPMIGGLWLTCGMPLHVCATYQLVYIWVIQKRTLNV